MPSVQFRHREECSCNIGRVNTCFCNLQKCRFHHETACANKGYATASNYHQPSTASTSTFKGSSSHRDSFDEPNDGLNCRELFSGPLDHSQCESPGKVSIPPHSRLLSHHNRWRTSVLLQFQGELGSFWRFEVTSKL